MPSLKIVFYLIALLAIGTLVAVAVGITGTRLGIWDFRTGLGIQMTMHYPAMVLAGLAGLSTIIALIRRSPPRILLFLGTLAAGFTAYTATEFKQQVAANPFIHDITTDFDNPPEIVAGASLPRANPPHYVGAQQAPRSNLTIAETQRDAFPDITPLVVAMELEDAARLSRSILDEMKLEILETGSGGAGETIEATATSFWYGFVDDFVVRLTPQEGETRIDIRSKSRVGLSDLGANAARVRDLMTKLYQKNPNARIVD